MLSDVSSSKNSSIKNILSSFVDDSLSDVKKSEIENKEKKFKKTLENKEIRIKCRKADSLFKNFTEEVKELEIKLDHYKPESFKIDDSSRVNSQYSEI